MPAANRGRRLRRLSPVTFYAALGELPRGALNITKTRRIGASHNFSAQSPQLSY
jgi:hypothetical protein